MRFYFDITWDSNSAHKTDGKSDPARIIRVYEDSDFKIHSKTWISARVERYDIETSPEQFGRLTDDLYGIQGVEEIRIKKRPD